MAATPITIAESDRFQESPARGISSTRAHGTRALPPRYASSLDLRRPLRHSTYSGLLQKRSQKSDTTWKQRYFALRGSHLVYSRQEPRSDADLALQKSIDLSDVRRVRTRARDLQIQIRTTDREFVLRAPTLEELNQWIFGFAQSIQVTAREILENSPSSGSSCSDEGSGSELDDSLSNLPMVSRMVSASPDHGGIPMSLPARRRADSWQADPPSPYDHGHRAGAPHRVQFGRAQSDMGSARPREPLFAKVKIGGRFGEAISSDEDDDDEDDDAQPYVSSYDDDMFRMDDEEDSSPAIAVHSAVHSPVVATSPLLSGKSRRPPFPPAAADTGFGSGVGSPGKATSRLGTSGLACSPVVVDPPAAPAPAAAAPLHKTSAPWRPRRYPRSTTEPSHAEMPSAAAPAAAPASSKPQPWRPRHKREAGTANPAPKAQPWRPKRRPTGGVGAGGGLLGSPPAHPGTGSLSGGSDKHGSYDRHGSQDRHGSHDRRHGHHHGSHHKHGSQESGSGHGQGHAHGHGAGRKRRGSRAGRDSRRERHGAVTHRDGSARYGLYSAQGSRPAMEDAHVVIQDGHAHFDSLDQSSWTSKFSVYGVYDGHAGSGASTWAAEKIAPLLVEHGSFWADPVAAMTSAYEDCDAAFMEEYARDTSSKQFGSGSTAITVLIKGRTVYVANLGDSRAALCTGAGVAVALSHDQTPESEQERIEAAGGWVVVEQELRFSSLHTLNLHDPSVFSKVGERVKYNIFRLNGDLAVSRAIGDAVYKREHKNDWFWNWPSDHDRVFHADLVLSTPEIMEHELKDDDEFIIIACDGLWDVLTNQEAVTKLRAFLSEEGATPESACEKLVDLALQLGTTDNVTAMVVLLPEVLEGE